MKLKSNARQLNRSVICAPRWCVALVTVLAVAGSALGSPPTVTKPTITAASVSLGDQVILESHASGTPPLSFQWQLNGNDIPGANELTLVLSDVQMSDEGQYTLVATNIEGQMTSPPTALDVDPTFTLVPVLGEESGNIQGAWGDVDNDGWLDLWVTRKGSSRLFMNSRDGSFDPGLPLPHQAANTDTIVTFGDYNNDGLLDLAMVEELANLLTVRHNDGEGQFSLAKQDFPRSPMTGAWLDFDADGHLDLCVTRDAAGAVLYRNRQNGALEPVAAGEPGWDLAAAIYNVRSPAFGDYNGDGLMDVFAPVWNARHRLLRNQGDGTFVNDTQFPASSISVFGAAWADFDNDGDMDLLAPGLFSASIFYQNRGGGSLVAMSAAEVGSLVTDNALSYAVSWGDYDNDGDLDVYVSNVDAAFRDGTLNFLYANQGDGSFVRVLSGSPVTRKHLRWLASWADYDNDGFLDLLAASVTGPNELYRNNGRDNGNGNHWLKVQCEGRVSNRSGIGAKVHLNAQIGGRDTWQIREITSSFTGAPLLAHFGLGNAERIDTLRVEWPSGIVQEVHDVAADQFLTIVEERPSAQLLHPTVTGGRFEFTLTGVVGTTYRIEVSTNLVNWALMGEETLSQPEQVISGGAVGSLDAFFYRATETR